MAKSCQHCGKELKDVMDVKASKDGQFVYKRNPHTLCRECHASFRQRQTLGYKIALAQLAKMTRIDKMEAEIVASVASLRSCK